MISICLSHIGKPTKSRIRKIPKPLHVLQLLSFIGLTLLGNFAGHAKTHMKRVVVLPFVGPEAMRARAGVLKSIASKGHIISLRRYYRIASQLGLDPQNQRSIPRICSKIHCDVVLVGKITRKGRHSIITVAVVDGRSGRIKGRRTARVHDLNRLINAGARVGLSCTPLIYQSQHHGIKVYALPPRSPMRHPQRPRSSPARARRRQRAAENSAAYNDPYFDAEQDETEMDDKDAEDEYEDDAITVYDEDGVDGYEEYDEDGEHSVRKQNSRGDLTDLLAGFFDFSLGLGVGHRSCEMQSVTDSPDSPSKYDGGSYPELLFHMNIYPLFPLIKRRKPSLRRWLRFGLGFRYALPLSISTTLKSKPDEEIETSSSELLIDLNYRVRISDRPSSIELMGTFGYGMREFSIGPNTIMASFNYRFLRFGLNASIPIITPLLNLTAGLDLRPLLGAGTDPGEAVYHYGKLTSGGAWGLSGGFFGRLDLGLFYFARFEMLNISANFSGVDLGETSKEPLDRTSPSSSSDSFRRFYLGLGYAF